MSVMWTNEQKEVILHRGGDLLVSAAAGSGKTAVLVEHLVSRITDPADPVSVREFLVVTFTEAAAAEMKERLVEKLEKTLAEDPDNETLRMQASLVGQAHIQTIDSFCQWLVRSHFHELDLDPDFRILESGEERLLRADVLEEMLEEKYRSADADYLDFADRCARRGDDARIGDMILRLYDFSRSAPEPSAWLARCREAFCDEPLKKAYWTSGLETEIRGRLQDLRDTLSAAEERIFPYDCMEKYQETLAQDRTGIELILDEKDISGLLGALRTWKPVRLSYNKKLDEMPELKEEIKALRTLVKDETGKLRDEFAFAEPAEMEEALLGTRAPVEELVWLTEEFSALYGEAKRDRNAADFPDVEHWALSLMRREGQPTELARTVGNIFREIAVDEYQDSNLIQEQILTALQGKEGREPRLFFVGDVKQSIYKFRMARPELFLEKYDSYSAQPEAPQRKIELAANFRTRPEILNFVNHLFYRIMRREPGGILYAEDCALRAGAEYPGEGEPAELLITGVSDGEDTTAAEAQLAADRIRRMTDPVAGTKIYDKERQEMRPVRYGDIAILLRRMKNTAPVFEEVLRDNGISASVVRTTGYFDAVEVRVMLNALTVLDNPRQDIPLASVLLSPIGRFTEDELAAVRAGADREEGLSLYEAALRSDIPAMREFMARLEYFREYAVHHTIDEVIGAILEDSGYDLVLAAMPSGSVRLANIGMLRQKARDFEQTSYHGIFQFVRYIEKIRQYEVDYGAAAADGSGDNAVRILSVHKSKGLEYPVVFVSGLGGRMDPPDLKNEFLFQEDLGAACDFMDLEHSVKRKSLWKSVLRSRVRRDALGEEQRILYVALTRAREKLVLTAALREKAGDEDQPVHNPWEKYRAFRDMEELPYWLRMSAGSMLDWVLMAGECPQLDCRYAPAREGGSPEANRAKEEQKERARLEEELSFLSEEDRRFWQDRLLHPYPYSELTELKPVWTVSEIKRYGMPEEEHIPLIPGVPGGSHRGTVYHRVMQFFPPSLLEGKKPEECAECIAAWMGGHLPAEDAGLVDPADIAAFYAGPLGQEVIRAETEGRRYTEMPFVLGVPAEEFTSGRIFRCDGADKKIRNGEALPVGRLPLTESEESVPEESPGDKGSRSEDLILVQGILDLALLTEEGWILIDYKTDAVKYPKDLLREYRLQLALYARALTRLTGKRVIRRLIWSFRHDCLLEDLPAGC